MGEPRLREIRLAKGMTQEGLAREAGITLSSLRNAERGRNVPHLRKAQRLAAVLGVTVDALFEEAAS